jgi:hypothetical protein
MRTHIYKDCKNEACPSHENKSLGNIWGQPLHHIFAEDGREFSTCDVCKETNHFKDPDAINKISYPYYNASLGKTFESKHQEAKYAKDNGFAVKDYRSKDRARTK